MNNTHLRRVTVFGSSSPLPGEQAYRQAYEIGRRIGRHGLEVVNGGYSGTMEASARGATEMGGSALGILVDTFNYAPANPYLTCTIRTGSLLERLDKLLSLGDIIVVLPGGTGTLVELSLAWEYNLKRLQEKPVLIDFFWKPLRELISSHQFTAESEKIPAPFNRTPFFSDDPVDDLERLLSLY